MSKNPDMAAQLASGHWRAAKPERYAIAVTTCLMANVTRSGIVRMLSGGNKSPVAQHRLRGRKEQRSFGSLRFSFCAQACQ
jgi:hypothetical protein